jgi:hypothetical protein
VNPVPANHAPLSGELFRDAWTRCSPGGRMQIRLWLLAPSHDLARGRDLFLCAIFPSANEELALLERELVTGKHVELETRLQSSSLPGTVPDEAAPGVIFVVEKYFIGGLPLEAHPAHRRSHVTGKLAAAGDHSLEPDELPLGDPAPKGPT